MAREAVCNSAGRRSEHYLNLPLRNCFCPWRSCNKSALRAGLCLRVPEPTSRMRQFHLITSSVQCVAALRRRLADNRIDFYHCFLVLGTGRDPASIGLDHGCNRSRALALRDRTFGSAKARWANLEMSQSRHGRTSSCAAPASADSPQPWRAPNGLDLESPSVAINGRQIRAGVRCRCLSRSHDRRDVGSLLAR